MEQILLGFNLSFVDFKQFLEKSHNKVMQLLHWDVDMKKSDKT